MSNFYKILNEWGGDEPGLEQNPKDMRHVTGKSVLKKASSIENYSVSDELRIAALDVAKRVIEIDLDFDDIAAENLIDNAIRKTIPEFNFDEYEREKNAENYKGIHHRIYMNFHKLILKILKAVNYKKASY